ncbi:MAG: imidazole glycerol phosphate synthase subunit HisH, partial [Sphingobacteriales bacterium]
MSIVIIDYGAGNVRSVQFALERLGVAAVLTSDTSSIAQADKVIFPGVGEAATAMKALHSAGLDTVIPQLKQPVLGICLGMQLLCDYSEEGGTQGLGIFPVGVKRFAAKAKVPHMGWNNIS